MKFSIDFRIDVDGELLDASSLESSTGKHRLTLVDTGALEGAVVIRVDDEEVCGDYADPIVRLIDQWIRKLPWIIGGDTETVALRNSEHCFAFIPEGESVEVSYFQGSEAEIEEYVLEPINVRKDIFVTESIAAGERLLEIFRQADPELLESNEDVRDLNTTVTEARRVWKEHLLRQRR